jgi:hypothetical protein
MSCMCQQQRGSHCRVCSESIYNMLLEALVFKKKYLSIETSHFLRALPTGLSDREATKVIRLAVDEVCSKASDTPMDGARMVLSDGRSRVGYQPDDKTHKPAPGCRDPLSNWDRLYMNCWLIRCIDNDNIDNIDYTINLYKHYKHIDHSKVDRRRKRKRKLSEVYEGISSDLQPEIARNS